MIGQGNQHDTDRATQEDLQALRHALSVEGNAVKFYAHAAKLAASPGGRVAFLYLADQEQRHLDVLVAEISRLSPGPVEPTRAAKAPKPDEERFFTAPNDALGAVTMAIGEEQDSQTLFLDMKERCATQGVKQLFDQLASDEDRHLTILKEMQEVIGTDHLSQFNFDPMAYGENPLDRRKGDDTETRFGNYLESLGLRMTPEREKILSEVTSRVGHFDVETLCAGIREKGISVSRATAYRTLGLMVKCGLVRRIWMGEDRFLYESPYDRRELPRGVAKRHGHLVCEKCGKAEEFFDENIDVRLEAISWRSNFIARRHSLQVFGFCEECRESGEQLHLGR